MTITESISAPSVSPSKPAPKKSRGGKKLVSKPVVETAPPEPAITAILIEEGKPVNSAAAAVPTIKKPSHKKKSKLIVKEVNTALENESIGNIILHLTCSLDDLETFKKTQLQDPLKYNPEIPLEIQTFEKPSQFANYNVETQNTWKPPLAYQSFCPKCNEIVIPSSSVESAALTSPIDPSKKPIQEFPSLATTAAPSGSSATTTTKTDQQLQQKVRELKITYFMEHVDLNKQSACFWCTGDFNYKPFYLPRLETNDTMIVYGSFCCPECAVAFLFKETIDDTMKFERYHLLQKLYRDSNAAIGEIIRPAPNPFYLLDKFLGNLSIQEYRHLIRTQKHNYIVTLDKPMTRVLPEIHSEGDLMTHSSTYKIRRPTDIAGSAAGTAPTSSSMKN